MPDGRGNASWLCDGSCVERLAFPGVTGSPPMQLTLPDAGGVRRWQTWETTRALELKQTLACPGSPQAHGSSPSTLGWSARAKGYDVLLSVPYHAV